MQGNRRSSSSSQKGFTLIELLVVVAIIGILASIVLASLSGARSKGRDAKRVSDIKQLQLALELYYDANQNYPTGSTVPSSALTTSGYISVIPTDPSGGTAAYGYVALPAGCDNSATTCSTYLLAAKLEASNTALSSTYTGDSVDSLTVNGTSVKCDGSTATLFCSVP